MNLKESTVYTIAFAGAIIILVLFQGFLISKGFYSISADESLHTMNAYLWSRNHYHENYVWLPFYRIFVGSFLFFFNDLIIVPRIISIVFGALSVLAVSFLSHQLFRNQIITIITAFFAAIISPLLIFSVLPLLEIIFFFFILMAFTFFIKWTKTKRTYSLISVCIFLFISNTIRYESWIYSLSFFIIMVYLIYRDTAITNKLRLIITAGLILAIFPLYWIISDFIAAGRLFGFVGIVSSAYRPETVKYNMEYNPLFQFIKTNSMSLNILGLISLIILSIKDKNVRIFLVVFFISLFTMSLSAFFGKTMPSHNFWRIAGSWSILLLPFTAYLLNLFLITGFSLKYLNVLMFIIITAIVAFFFIRQDLNYSSTSYFTSADLKTGKFIQQLTKQKNNSGRILIVSYDWHYSNVEISSGEPLLFEHLIKPAQDNEYISMDMTIHFNNALLKKNSIRYLILPSSFLEGYEVENVKVVRLKTIGYWAVYKIAG